MATLNEILFKIKERDSSFNLTDDYKVDDELIISMMNDVRGTLIREEKNKSGFISSDFYQMNCCYEIDCVEGSCTFEGIEIGDGKYSYQVKLKPHVKGLKGLEIKHVGDRLGTVKFNIVSFNEFTALEGRVWTKKMKVGTIVGSDLLLKNLPTKGMKFICLLELLEDPRVACDWRNDESEYHVPSVTKFVDMVLYRLMLSGRMPDDKLNNGTDDTANPKIADSVIAQQQRLQTEGSDRTQSTSNQKK